MKPTPKRLTRSLLFIRPHGLPIYVARVPASLSFSLNFMTRVAVLVVSVGLAACATQDDWHLSQSQALAIGNRALAANNLDPAKYRWHQHLSRFTDTRDWHIEFSPRYPGPGG